MTAPGSGYTVGEARALIAPIVGCEPDEVTDFVIVAAARPCSDCGGHALAFATGRPGQPDEQDAAARLLAGALNYLLNGEPQ